MSGLQLEGLSRHYGDVRAVDEVSLRVPAGSFVCLLGPSGCGKTTLLRMVAGLERPTAGRVRLDGRDLTEVPTHRRELGMVFQSLALFPHLDVGDNIAYALAVRGRPRAERRARVQELLELVRLPGIERRAVAALSGGQRQRVAIARALALAPKLFLLDEPLSALDAKLRETLQIELRELQQRLGVTTVVVTHDQREAMTMADLVVVMGEGRVRQFAPPVEIYRRPADTFVADFVGQTNLLPLVREAGGARVLGRRVAGLSLDALEADAGVLSVRPEDVRLGPARAPATASEESVEGLLGTVRFVRDLGASIETFVDLDAGDGDGDGDGDDLRDAGDERGDGGGDGGGDVDDRGAGLGVVAVSMPHGEAGDDGARGRLRVGERVRVTFDVGRAVVLPR